MDEENQNNISADPASLSVKRKRGRPRKDDVSSSDSAKRKSHKSMHSSQVENVLVGQFVSGVLDGRFDAGYMLTVTVGNTGSVLTGVVFEPGRVVPISAENDIAPNVEMLKRSDVSIPTTGHLDQPRPSKDEVTIHPKGPSPVPADLTLKPTPKVQISQVPVPNNVSEVIYSNANHKSSLSAPCHDSGDHSNLTTTDVPQSSASEAKEIQAIETASQYSAPEAMEIQANEKVQQFSASEAMKIQTSETAPQYSANEAMEIQANEKVPQSSASEAMKIQTSETTPQYSANEAMEIQANEKVPQSSASEAMKIQQTSETAPQYSAYEAMEIQANDKVLQSSVSETMKIQTSETSPQYSAYEAKEIQAIEMAPQSVASEEKEIQATEMMPQSSAPEPKEIQKTEIETQETENAVTKVVQLEGNMTGFPTDFLPAAAPGLPTSEAKNIIKTSGTPNDVPILENEHLGHPPIITPEVAIQAPEHQIERTIDFLGGSLGSHQANKPSVDASSDKHNDEVLMGNDSEEETKTLVECEPHLAAQEELTPKTSPSMLSLQQPSDFADTDSNIA